MTVSPEEELRELIAEYGWAVRQVFGDPDTGSPRFSYTIGLTGMGHPEVVVVGMPFDPAHSFLTDVVELVRGGRRFEHGARTDELTDPPSTVVFVSVEDVSLLGAASEFYGPVQAVQLVWPDSAGHLPWDPGCVNPPDAQRLPGP